ncbi:P68 family surface lipoprotein [Metamycoplasma equirhinis]|uniref:P68 family surface lipoprotein n=1 Tax=Metamycoplasma equirhinis TaxID=92402 RepID=UPI003593F808
MKKINKVLLAVVPATAILATAPLASRCNSPRFEQEFDGIIQISAGFSSTNVQGQGLQGIVDAYNKWIGYDFGLKKWASTNKKAEGYLPAEIKTSAKGYNTGDLSLKLTSKDKKEFYNIIINYPAAASLLARYKMNIAIDEAKYESFGIAKAFKDLNKTIAGNSNNEKWAIPFSRSSEMNAVAKKLLGKLLKELKELASLEIDADNSTKINEYIKSYENDVQEKAGIEKVWNSGKYKDENKDKVIAKIKSHIKGKLSDDLFTSYEGIINLAIAAKAMYPHNISNYILGFDSLPNAINVMASSLSAGKLEDGYITPNPELAKTGGWDFYSFLRDSNSKQYKLFKKIVDLLLTGINEGAVWVGGAGKYGSSLLTGYNLAMSIGSTAGFSHTYVTGSGDNIYKHKIDGTDYQLIEPLESIKSNQNLTNDKVLYFKSGGYSNSIFLSTASNVGKYDKQLASVEADKIAISISEKDASSNFKGAEGFIIEKTSAFEVANDKIVLKYKDGSQTKTKELSGKVLGKFFKNDDKEYLFLEKNEVKSEKQTSSDLVNKDDATWISAPLSYSLSDAKKGVFTQGPSLIGIHANAKEDAATKLFIEWLYKTKLDEVTFRTGKKGQETETKIQNVSPLDAFNQVASYISPTEEFFKKEASDPSLKFNEAMKIAFENFKKVGLDLKYITSDDIAASESDALRNAITSAADSATADAQSNTITDFNKFVKNIEKSFKLD